MLDQEFLYYKEHQRELVTKYRGKYLVVKDQKVIDCYESEIEAVIETSKVYDLGTFLVQKCEPGQGNYTAIFHSRVAQGCE